MDLCRVYEVVSCKIGDLVKRVSFHRMSWGHLDANKIQSSQELYKFLYVFAFQDGFDSGPVLAVMTTLLSVAFQEVYYTSVITILSYFQLLVYYFVMILVMIYDLFLIHDLLPY